MPKISVIVPVYGVEKYIERCAISLFEQTLDDIEYIFVNDCTKDNSIGVLKKVLSRYPKRIQQTKIVELPVNSGLPIARRYGLQYASGDYIAYCDSDDWMDLNAYNKLWTKAKESDYDIIFFDWYRSDGINHEARNRHNFDFSSKRNTFASISRNIYWSVAFAITKRSLYIENEIDYPKHNNGEDFALMLQLIHYAKSYSKVDNCLYYYYYNPESITNVPSEEGYLKRFNQLIQNTELVIRFFNKHGIAKKYKDLIILYKLYCRTKISDLTIQSQYYELWNSTYPELNIFNVLLNSIIPFKTRLHYVLVRLKIYNLLNKK